MSFMISLQMFFFSALFVILGENIMISSTCTKPLMQYFLVSIKLKTSKKHKVISTIPNRRR